MMHLTEAIAARAVGAFPLSVATSLAIESACGVHPEILVKSAPVLDYTELWVNLRTLYRNFMGSLDKETHNGIVPSEIAATLSTEMDLISGIIADHTQSRVKVVYYVSNYAGMERLYRHAVLRTDNTPRQIEYSILLNKSIELLLKTRGPKEIAGFELKLKPQHQPKAMLLTHYAYDLLSAPAFNSMALLESHTGAIKLRAQWYTKYYQGKDLPMIPFREDFIQVFGDNETFRSMDIKLRKDLIDIATKYRWSSVTTHDKIVYGINQMENPFARELLKAILV